MDLSLLIKKSINSLEPRGHLFKGKEGKAKIIVCPNCHGRINKQQLADHYQVCLRCDHHFRMDSTSRLALIADEGTFQELDATMTSVNFLDFPGYSEKLKGAQQKSGQLEGVRTGFCKISHVPCGIFVMESQFMMGSMGSVVGEKITRLFEQAQAKKLPVVGFCASGGARMQEGITSLLQMAKTSAAIKQHSNAGLFYLSVLTDPTTGGVTASFAMEGDVIIAEPKALIGFAGPRVIEKTMKKKLPEDFQTAEMVLESGFLDHIVHRRNLKAYIRRILQLNGGNLERL